MDEARRELIDVLRGAVSLLARPGNCFDWSYWRDADEAIGDVNGLIASLEAGETPPFHDVTVLFVVAGPLQEVSLSSGWAYPFLTLAERFDAAADRFYGNGRMRK